MGSKGSSSSSFTPPPEVVAAYKEALGYGRAAMGQQYQPYTGEITAPLTPTQESGIYNVNRAVGTAIPYFGQATAMTANAANTPINPQQFSQEVIQQYQSPYTQAVANSTFANLREQQRQEQEGLQSQAIRAGAFGGDRAGIAAANMARQQDLATAQAMANIYNQGYGQAVGLFGQQQGVNLAAQQANALRQMQGAQQLANLGTGLQGSVLQGAQAQLAAGAQQQAVQQAINSGYYNQYLGAQAYPYQQAQFFANLATGVGGQMGGTTTSQQAQPSPVGSIFGALGALGAIMSDKRTKENIKPIGKTNDGQTIYRFNYKGDPTTQIGLIAQEVEKKHPEAVRTFNGVKGVDYKEATDDSVRSMGGGVVPTGQRHNFAAGGPSLSDEEDPMIPYKAGVPSKVLQIPKLAKIGGSKPNFGGEPPKSPSGPSAQDFKGAAEGLGKAWNKFNTPDTKISGFENLGKDFEDMLPASAFSAAFAARGGAIGGLRPHFDDGKKVPVTDDTITVSTSDSDPGPGLSPKEELPPFLKGEIARSVDSEGTPAGGVVPRPDIPLPPESSERPRDLSFPLIRKEEGFIPRTKWDVNAHRVGYSSDKMTTPEGNVVTVKEGDTTTRQDAERELTRRVVEGQRWIQSQIGEENWNRLSPEAQAAMTSIRYQYGEYPKRVLTAAMTGDNEAVAAAIASTPGPTPARRASEAALIRGQDQGLGAYEPEGSRYLKGGLGAVGGGGGGSRKAQDASVAATDAASGDRKWNFGMAGEGKRSVIESIMDRDFDPIQKRALFAFFAGMAASPSPWFGQQLGAGMQAASNVYNDSMNKQAEIGIKKEQLGLEEQKIGVQERLAGIQEKTKGLELLKFWQSQFIEVPSDTEKGVYYYRDVTNPSRILTASEYTSEMQKIMKQYGLSPADVGGVSAGATVKPGLAPEPKPVEAGAPPAGGVVPQPEVKKEAEPVQPTTRPIEPVTPVIPKPTTIPEQRPAPAQKTEEAKAEPVDLAKKYPNVVPEDMPENILDRAKRLRMEAENSRYSRNPNAQAKTADLEAQAKLLEDKAKEIENGDRKVRFTDGRPSDYLPGAVETKITRETQESEAKENVKNNMKLREKMATQEQKSFDGEVTARRIQKLLEGFRGGALADSLNNSKAILMDIGNAIGVPIDDKTISSWVADPAKYDEFVKLATKLSFGFVNEADVGKRMTNLEMTTSSKAQPSPTIQPEASANMVAEILALNQYNKEARRAMAAEMQRVGVNKFNESKFIADYNDKFGPDHFKKIYEGIRKDMGVRGATPTDRNKLTPGQVYILEPGTYGNRTGSPAKARFKANEREGGNIKTIFDPVE